MARQDDFDAWFALAREFAPGLLSVPDYGWYDAYLDGLTPLEAVSSLPDSPPASRPSLWARLKRQWLAADGA